MCGRYTLYSSPNDLAKYFSASLNYHYGPSYNIAPTATIAVLVALEGERLIVPMRWGLIPAWHRAGQKLTVLNNAKLETIDTKPSFRVSFKRHRCLILANGFYEWESTPKPKQPHYFYRKDQQPIALAGIWDKWVTEDNTIDSCCIITEAANTIVASVHERMPAIITPDKFDAWLDAGVQEVSVIKKMASQGKAYAGIVQHAVTNKMNLVKFNNSDCIEAI